FNLPARIIARRIDDAYPLVSTPQIVTARALASLPVLLELSAPWLTAGACGLFHKGRDYRAEVQENVNRWTFDLVEHPSVTDASGVILELSNVRPV
ncbi:16S rRNA (guanine(527)-N(7))-methyltransferase RsmG, partial [Mesorhizobium sp. M00.F.Ca.ET.158.01.1.1]